MFFGNHDDDVICFKKGEEMGRFKLGSTVINLFAPNSVKFDASMENGVPTRMGTPFAHIAK